jgi:hypothetical protein
LKAFLQPPSDEDTADADVAALILAMPGSGKTRTVIEAAKGKTYKRFRMSNHKFEDALSVEVFLSNSVAAACGEDAVPVTRNDVVVVHFDEIQSLMVAPNESTTKLLVAMLADAIDALVNDAENPRLWLKFVMTGTNVFTRKAIKHGSEMKALPIPLDGSFSLAFVTKLVTDWKLQHLFCGNNYLERVGTIDASLNSFSVLSGTDPVRQTLMSGLRMNMPLYL